MLKAIIFDLDDTLLWDNKSITEAFKSTCQLATNKYNINSEKLEENVRQAAEQIYPTYDIYNFVSKIEITALEAFWGEFSEEGEDYRKLRNIVGDYRKKSWLQGLQAVGINDEFLAEEMAETFPEERKRHVYLYEETLDVLEELKGKYQLLMLTNGSSSLQNKKIKMSPELKLYFEYIIISGTFGSGKPDPAIFKHALNLLSINNSEALMVGDNLHTDILGAIRTGINSVWINHYGVKCNEIKPTYQITRLRELIPLIENKNNEN